MGRRRKNADIIDEYLEDIRELQKDTGRKKPWQPRGDKIPPNKPHRLKNKYDREKERAWDWRKHIHNGDE